MLKPEYLIKHLEGSYQLLSLLFQFFIIVCDVIYRGYLTHNDAALECRTVEEGRARDRNLE